MAKYNIARLQEFFFEAALATYASGKKADPFPELTGAKYFWHQRGELCYGDIYLVNGEHSGGQTIIWVHGVPAWLMQYHGWCKDDDKEVLTFLKKALLAAYECREFHGGRGLPRFEGRIKDYLVYTNSPQAPRHVRCEEDFAGFMGHEQIQLPDATVVFWHRYQGLLLGEPEK